MKRYEITLEGVTPILMHKDNLSFSEKIKAWQIDPANKEHSKAGDDRSPPWSWLGYLYHNRRVVGIPADNLMTCIREGGAKVKTGGSNSKETYKKHTQFGIIIDTEQWDLHINGNSTVDVRPLEKLIGVMDFATHIEAAEQAGFELFIRRAKVGASKHVRVRPIFREWVAVGTLTIVDEELSGITRPVLERILTQAGSMCGVCDWRPSSPKSPGSFGKFVPKLRVIK